MNVIGIVNDESAPVVVDEYQSVIDAADKLGLKILVIGYGCDMRSSLMERIIESERFEIIQQRPAWDRFPGNIRQASGGGPRDKWGRLK